MFSRASRPRSAPANASAARPSGFKQTSLCSSAVLRCACLTLDAATPDGCRQAWIARSCPAERLCKQRFATLCVQLLNEIGEQEVKKPCKLAQHQGTAAWLTGQGALVDPPGCLQKLKSGSLAAGSSACGMSSAFMGRTMSGSLVRCRRPCAQLSVRLSWCCTQQMLSASPPAGAGSWAPGRCAASLPPHTASRCAGRTGALASGPAAPA